MWSEIVSVLTDVSNSIADVVDEVAEGIFVGGETAPSAAAHGDATAPARGGASHRRSQPPPPAVATTHADMTAHDTATRRIMLAADAETNDVGDQTPRTAAGSSSTPPRGARGGARHATGRNAAGDDDDSSSVVLTDQNPTTTASDGRNDDAEDDDDAGGSSVRTADSDVHGSLHTPGRVRPRPRGESPQNTGRAVDDSPATAYARKHQQLVRMRRLPGADTDRPALAVLGSGTVVPLWPQVSSPSGALAAAPVASSLSPPVATQHAADDFDFADVEHDDDDDGKSPGVAGSGGGADWVRLDHAHYYDGRGGGPAAEPLPAAAHIALSATAVSTVALATSTEALRVLVRARYRLLQQPLSVAAPRRACREPRSPSIAGTDFVVV